MHLHFRYSLIATVFRNNRFPKKVDVTSSPAHQYQDNEFAGIPGFLAGRESKSDQCITRCVLHRRAAGREPSEFSLAESMSLQPAKRWQVDRGFLYVLLAAKDFRRKANHKSGHPLNCDALLSNRRGAGRRLQQAEKSFPAKRTYSLHITLAHTYVS